MKKILITILTILLCVGIGGGAFALAKRFEETPPVSEQPDSGSNEEQTDDNSTPGVSGGTIMGGSDEQTALTIPANAEELYQDGLTMQKGAALYFGTSERPALRFACNVSHELRAEVEADDSLTFAMLCIPTAYFNHVNTENYTCIDWVNAFDAAGIDSYYLSEFNIEQVVLENNQYVYRYRLEDIPAKAVNMEVTCMGVLIKTNEDGSKTYTYSHMPEGETYKSNSRTIAYVACAALSATALGYDTYTEDALEVIRGYLNEAVDLSNGLETPTDDNSQFEYTVNKTVVELSVGETFQLETNVESKVRVPVFYAAQDSAIAAVDGNGLITAQSAGETVILIYVAEVLTEVTVTVA